MAGRSKSVLSGAPGREGLRPVEVDLVLVDEPGQRVRLSLDRAKVEELAASIREVGLLQPPGLRGIGGRWQVVWGWHRVEACRLLGWRRMPAVVVVADDTRAVVLQVTENLERHDMSPVEEAAATSALYQAVGEDVDAVAARLNRSRGWVEGRLRMMSWPADLQELVHLGRLSAGAAAELALVSDEGHRRFLSSHAVDGGATARTCMGWRIAWQASGVVDDATVQQVAPGRELPPPEEALLPCYGCGRRFRFGELVHIWQCPSCREAYQAALDAVARGGNGNPPAGEPPAGGR